MSAPHIIANMACGWQRDPAGHRSGTVNTGVSAALWTHDRDDVQEVSCEPDPATHIVSVQQSSFWAEVWKDGRRAFAKVVQPGMFSLMQAGVRPRAIHRSRWRVLHLYVPDTLIRDLSEQDGLVSRSGGVELTDPQCGHDQVIKRLGDEVLGELHADAPLSRLRIDALGQDLAIRLLRTHSNIASHRFAAVTAKGGLAGWQVRRVSEYIQDRLSEDVRLDELASLVGLSPRHLCTAFRQSTGLPPHRWQIERRVERAKQMLANPAHSITDVALACGFGSSAHFATMFRRAMGQTPREWRRRAA